MALDTFLFLEGIDGESTATILEKPQSITNVPFEIMHWSFGASNPSTVGSGKQGISAGKVSVSSFNVTKKSEDASAKLFLNCCVGQHIPKGSVIMRKAGGKSHKQFTFMQYDFQQIMVDSIQWSASSGGDDTPMESISFAFAEVTIQYYVQDAKTGGPIKSAGATWNLTKVTE